MSEYPSMETTMAGGDNAQGTPGVDNPDLFVPPQGSGGEGYVTIIQDGQTYAIPAADYATMMEQPDLQEATRDLNRTDFKQEGEGSSIASCLEPVISQTAVTHSTNVKPVTVAVNPPVQIKPSTSPATKKFIPITAKPPQPGQNLVPLKPGPAPATKPTAQKKIFTSAAPRKHTFPTMQEVVQKSPETAVKKNYKPIRVDNWGIFLLSRLQSYFQKKEYCDLTLRFPAKNAQIKVHRLILNACTDYFGQLEKDVVDNALDMPANFTPEAVAPIIRFMYTGKIELKDTTYDQLRQTAETLQMGVLTKLMDAQVNNSDSSTDTTGQSRKRHSKGAFDDDPVEQIRKIRRIEKRVALEEKKALKVMELNAAKLPGKKLPIWKKKVTGQESKPATYSKETNSLHGYKIPKMNEDGAEAVLNIVDKVIEKSREGDDSETSHMQIAPDSGQLIPSPVVGATYKRRSPGEKPKIPRRLQEIQQHLMFEKILKTGTKNNLMQQKEAAVGNKDLSIDEVKELMEEQKQRSANIAQEYDGEDDAYDYNEDTLDMDDDYIDNVDSPAALGNTEEEQGEPSKLESQQKPIITDTNLKEPIKNENKPPAQVAIESQTIEAPVAKKSHAEMLSDSATKELDEALEEFSRVAEEEAEELTREDSLQETKDFKNEPKTITNDPKKPRRGRPPRWLKEQTLQMGAEARQKISQTSTSSSSTIDLKKPITEVQAQGEPANQSQLINEVLKKYPNLIKDNKAVKIKVLTKDPTGKSVTKLITLKAQGGQSVPRQPEPTVPDPPPSVGAFRPVEKVMYTGKRGRPKKVKPGDFDPHLEERKKINARLKRDFPQLASQITGGVGGNEDNEEDMDDIQLTEDIDEVINQENKTDIQVSLAGASSNLLATVESQNQMQAPAQTILMENGQLILTPGSQLPPLATFHQGQPTPSGEMIQLVTADGQLLTTMPKGKLATFTMPATFNIMTSQPQQILAPTNTMGMSNLGGIAAPPPVTVSFMTMPSTSNLTGMVPVTADMLQQQAPPTQVLPQQTIHEESQKVLNRIVNDWDSEEDTK